MDRETVRVLVVTSEGACGIAESSAMLKEAVEEADPAIKIALHTDLHPQSLNGLSVRPIIHLNYHAALHSQWTPEWVQKYRDGGAKVLITFHDTGVPNSEQCKALHAVADAFVVHEPCTDLPGAYYWRQGVPAPVRPDRTWGRPCPGRPLLGSIGFAFGWKQYEVLAEATAAAGWELLLIAPTATTEQVKAWQALNPHTTVFTSFVERQLALAFLTSCDATAFMYVNANTGTSGALRQGIATRKPVIASVERCCRQFRDLATDDLAMRAITWIVPDVATLTEALSRVRIAPYDTAMVRLAERDSWANLGKQYVALYRSLVDA